MWRREFVANSSANSLPSMSQSPAPHISGTSMVLARFSSALDEFPSQLNTHLVSVFYYPFIPRIVSSHPGSKPSSPEVFNSFTGAGLLQHYVKEGKSENDIRQMVNQFCTSLKIQTPRVCQGVAELFTDGVVHVLRNSQLGPKEICSFIIGDGCGDVYNPYHDWEVVFPPVPKPKVIPPKLPKVSSSSRCLTGSGFTPNFLFQGWCAIIQSFTIIRCPLGSILR